MFTHPQQLYFLLPRQPIPDVLYVKRLTANSIKGVQLELSELSILAGIPGL